MAAAAGLVVVLAAAAAAPLLLTSSGSSTGGARPSPRTRVRLPSASAVATTGGAGYVTDDLRDLLLRFDPATGRTGPSVHLAGRPTALAVAGGHLWVADMVDNQVVEVDPATLHVVRSVSVPAGPSGLAVLGGTVWVSSLVANVLTPIDTRSGTAGVALAVAAGAVRVAAGFGALWVTGTSNLLTRVVPAAGGATPAERTVTVGQGPIGVATGAGAVWVADAQGNAVSEVDPTTLHVDRLAGVGDDPLSVGVSAAGRVYVGFGTAQTVRVVSPGPSSKVLDLDTDPRALLPASAGVWVAGANPGRVLAVTPG